VAGVVLALVALPLLTVLLSVLQGALNLTSDVLAFLLAVVGVALVGGMWPALGAAVLATLLLNYFFTPPMRTLSIAERNNALALIGFVAVGAMVSAVVDLAARRTGEAARAAAESEVLSTLSGDVLRGEFALPALLDRVREIFGMTSAVLLERSGSTWVPVATSGPAPCRTPEEGDVDVPVGDDLALVLRGRPLAAEDRRLLTAFGAQAAVVLRQRRLAEAVAEAEPLAEVDRTRTALLAAVSHDLRSPLASAKAAVSALRSTEMSLDAGQDAELLATADESLDKLTRLIENLLDLSRLQAGALAVFPQRVWLDDALPAALDELGPAAAGVELTSEYDLPAVRADPGLLERILVNVIANALRHSPPGAPPLVTVSAHRDRVEVRVVDFGPGVPESEWDRIFVPFQRLGDRDNSTGVGLGLALSRGLADAMGGWLAPDDTPGGGLTMVLSLPALPSPGPDRPDPAEAPAGAVESRGTEGGP
jgi:two-component system sensor histidine kinase KdpD